MVNQKLVGRCGMYCGACVIHRAYRDSPSLRVWLAEKHGCPPGDVVCDGCQAVHARGWAKDPQWGKNCRILECLADHNIRFCHDCPERRSCKRWHDLAEYFEFLDMDLAANLQRIRAGETREWLEEQDRKWRCVHCGARMPASQEITLCLKCNRPARY